MAHILVVANLTLGGQALLDALAERLAQPGDHRLTVLVPTRSNPEGLTHSHEQDRQDSEARLQAALQRFARFGVPTSGELGDSRPVDAVMDALRDHPDVDEVLISTLPPGASRWLGMDVVSRLERVAEVPVRHVIGATEPASI